MPIKRHSTPCVVRTCGKSNRFTCLYLADGTKAVVKKGMGKQGTSAWIEVVPQDVLTPQKPKGKCELCGDTGTWPETTEQLGQPLTINRPCPNGCKPKGEYIMGKWSHSGWTGEMCKRCGRDQRIGWAVKNECWNRVVPEDRRMNILCLECFFEIADRDGHNVSKDDFVYMAVATDEDLVRPYFIEEE